MSNRGVFITGTDTDIGKTVVAAAVLAGMRGEGIDAAPMKPVQTGGGFRNGAPTSPDLDFCLRMAGLQVGAEEYRKMSPYIFEPACSPHLAAEKAGMEISFDRIADCFESLLETRDLVVVEGAGGVLVPIGGGKTTADLAARLDLPVILTARPGLGTINHTLLSLRELDRAGLTVLGVVFCETNATAWGEIEEDNRKTIGELGKTEILGRIPYMTGLAEGLMGQDAFRRVAVESIRAFHGVRARYDGA